LAVAALAARELETIPSVEAVAAGLPPFIAESVPHDGQANAVRPPGRVVTSDMYSPYATYQTDIPIIAHKTYF
jgi:hypothetical protein